jgi:hypothetical protein
MTCSVQGAIRSIDAEATIWLANILPLPEKGGLFVRMRTSCLFQVEKVAIKDSRFVPQKDWNRFHASSVRDDCVGSLNYSIASETPILQIYGQLRTTQF